MSRLKNETGNRYGRLLVLKQLESTSDSRAAWQCLCDCGEHTEVTGKNLRSKHTRSCGCLQKETAANALRETATRHGMYGTPEYTAWIEMRRRCEKSDRQGYKHWGGRGISVCKQWEQFDSFLEDMGTRPTPKHTLDRIDNDGDYSPRNCRWTTVTEQARNRRNNRTLTHKGQSLCLSAWAEKLGMKYTALQYRLQRGWSTDEALTTPVKGATR